MANTKLKRPTKSELIAEMRDIHVGSIAISAETLKLFLDNDPSCYSVAMSQQNQTLKTAMLTMLCINEGGTIEGLILNHGGKFVTDVIQYNDYENLELMELPFGEGEPILAGRLINCTIEPGADKLDEKQRIAAGLTKDGYKIYILGVPNSVKQPYVEVLKGKNKGKYKLTNRLVPSQDRDGVTRYSRSYWEETEPKDNLKFYDEDVTLDSKLDFIGDTFGLYPGEYFPDTEA